eukprot:4505230-Amphidinium_carterae.1
MQQVQSTSIERIVRGAQDSCTSSRHVHTDGSSGRFSNKCHCIAIGKAICISQDDLAEGSKPRGLRRLLQSGASLYKNALVCKRGSSYER